MAGGGAIRCWPSELHIYLQTCACDTDARRALGQPFGGRVTKTLKNGEPYLYDLVYRRKTDKLKKYIMMQFCSLIFYPGRPDDFF